MSQAYISHLASIPPENFTNVGVRVVVIGCGESEMIPFYKGAETCHRHHPHLEFRAESH